MAKKKAVKTRVRAACTVHRAAAVEPPEETLGITAKVMEAPLRRSPRPGSCQKFVRREIADAMPKICAMLLSRTMDGDLAALKLLLQMALESGQPQQAGTRRNTGFARKLLASFKDWEARETELKRDG